MSRTSKLPFFISEAYQNKEVNKILEAQADFAISLLRESGTSNEPKSVVMSPVSVAIALSMVFAGAKNKTADEFAQLLAKGAPENEIHQHFNSLLRLINSINKKYVLDSANCVFVQDEFPILDEYKRTLEEHYMGQFNSVDFKKSAEAAKTINHFVENATHGEIKDLVEESEFDEYTGLVLINAIYFQGTWAEKFDVSRTSKQPFHISEVHQKEVEMMFASDVDTYSYYMNDQVQVVGLPYMGNDVYFYLVLPSERFGVSKLLQNLTGKILLEWLQNARSWPMQGIDLYLPKFKLETKLELKKLLQNLGLKAFKGDSPDFSGISNRKDLYISNVVQKAVIEVNEEGTEAAAATGIQMRFLSGRPPVNANHPFLYFLTTAQHHVLFAGQFAG